MCRGNATLGGIPPLPPSVLISLSAANPESHRPSPPIVLHDSRVQFRSCLAQSASFLTKRRELYHEQTLDGEFFCNMQQARRGAEREGVRVSLWAVGGGFWLKIEPMSFSPFPSFFVWQTLAKWP